MFKPNIVDGILTSRFDEIKTHLNHQLSFSPNSNQGHILVNDKHYDFEVDKYGHLYSPAKLAGYDYYDGKSYLGHYNDMTFSPSRLENTVDELIKKMRRERVNFAELGQTEQQLKTILMSTASPPINIISKLLKDNIKGPGIVRVLKRLLPKLIGSVAVSEDIIRRFTDEIQRINTYGLHPNGQKMFELRFIQSRRGSGIIDTDKGIYQANNQFYYLRGEYGDYRYCDGAIPASTPDEAGQAAVFNDGGPFLAFDNFELVKVINVYISNNISKVYFYNHDPRAVGRGDAVFRSTLASDIEAAANPNRDPDLTLQANYASTRLNLNEYYNARDLPCDEIYVLDFAILREIARIFINERNENIYRARHNQDLVLRLYNTLDNPFQQKERYCDFVLSGSVYDAIAAGTPAGMN